MVKAEAVVTATSAHEPWLVWLSVNKPANVLLTPVKAATWLVPVLAVKVAVPPIRMLEFAR